MYEYQGLGDAFFLMLYGAAAWFALLACVYLLWRRGNAVVGDDIGSSRVLRRWTAAFMAAVFASHVWWVVLGQLCLTGDWLVRNIVAITLDRLTFLPLLMCVLLRMQQ